MHHQAEEMNWQSYNQNYLEEILESIRKLLTAYLATQIKSSDNTKTWPTYEFKWPELSPNKNNLLPLELLCDSFDRMGPIRKWKRIRRSRSRSGISSRRWNVLRL